ncbi:MAG: histidine phosphatase family protein [Desulfococcaceae bacterium]
MKSRHPKTAVLVLGNRRDFRFHLICFSFLLIAAALPALPRTAHGADADEAALWEALQSGGHIVMIRHALAPGSGDPPNFDVNDCATQRNLSDRGRDQARAIGAAFQEKNVPAGEVRTSAWCRCKETAELAFGEANVWPALNSFWQNRSAGPARVEKIQARLKQPVENGNLFLVTHYIGILNSTGEAVGSGEAVVVRPLPPDDFEVAGRLPFEIP